MQLFVHQLSKRVKYGALIWEKKYIYVYTHLFGNVLPHSQPSKNNLWHAIENSLLLRGYWTNSDGVFAEMQIISYNFIILKHIQINSLFREILMLKVRLSFWDNEWWPFIRILGSRLSMNRPFIINIGLGWFRCAVRIVDENSLDSRKARANFYKYGLHNMFDVMVIFRGTCPPITTQSLAYDITKELQPFARAKFIYTTFLIKGLSFSLVGSPL